MTAVKISGKWTNALPKGGQFWITSFPDDVTNDTFPSMTGVPPEYWDEDDCPIASLKSPNSTSLAVNVANCDDSRFVVCRKFSNVISETFCQHVVTLEFLLDPSNKPKRDKAISTKSSSTKKLFQKLDHARSYKSLFSSLWYSSLPCFDVKNISALKDGERSMLKYCEWQGKAVPCSAIFTSVPTDRGMCCSFNAEAAEELYASGPYSVNLRFSINFFVGICFSFAFKRIHIRKKITLV